MPAPIDRYKLYFKKKYKKSALLNNKFTDNLLVFLPKKIKYIYNKMRMMKNLI